MQKLLFVLLAASLIQASFSACADGTFANTYGAGATTKIECTNCLPFCKTCSSVTACLTYADNVFKGLDTATPPAPICSGSLTAATAYSKNDDACARCAEGCATCFVDYDYCTDCKAGWDWDRSAMRCVRATLGLSAVVLALSVLVLIFGVVTCILSCKL